MFAAILSKCKSSVYKCPHPQDEAKQISLKYQRKREVLFAAVDSNNWSGTAEISCDDVGTLTFTVAFPVRHARAIYGMDRRQLN